MWYWKSKVWQDGQEPVERYKANEHQATTELNIQIMVVDIRFTTIQSYWPHTKLLITLGGWHMGEQGLHNYTHTNRTYKFQNNASLHQHMLTYDNECHSNGHNSSFTHGQQIKYISQLTKKERDTKPFEQKKKHHAALNTNNNKKYMNDIKKSVSRMDLAWPLKKEYKCCMRVCSCDGIDYNRIGDCAIRIHI